MSVTTDKRTPTNPKFETGEAFKTLAVYTVTVCKSEKNFPKRNRWMLTQEIVKAAVKAYGHAVEANAVEVMTMRDYELRREHQVKARAKLKKLSAYTEIALLALGLDATKIDVWQGYVKTCKDLLGKWRESDRKRYKKLLEEQQRQYGHAGDG